ncbi:hypothetical protein Fcan01_27697 [Folsomia candida]|uniref:Uncharacterized protein n=1 Tax=Folsomia candida TaxID=158441 RepID=A0A226CYU8_FOLCA|nr:hypothetical protein Fcan01_27697 [Folsomia candida]
MADSRFQITPRLPSFLFELKSTFTQLFRNCQNVQYFFFDSTCGMSRNWWDKCMVLQRNNAILLPVENYGENLPISPAPTTVRATVQPPTTTRATTAPPATTTTTVATTIAATMATMNGTCQLLECCHFNCWIGAVCTKSMSPTTPPTCSDGGVPTMCANYVNPFSTYCHSLGCAPMSCQQTTCNAGNGNRLCTPYA